MKRLYWIACLALLSLTACGPVRHVFPPGANIEQLRTPVDGPWTVTLRLHNYSYDAGVRFDHVKLSITLAGEPAGSLDVDVNIDVAERSSDVIELPLTPDPAARQAMAALVADTSQRLPYVLQGTVQISNEGKNASSFPIDHKDWLSPAPGLAHVYR